MNRRANAARWATPRTNAIVPIITQAAPEFAEQRLMRTRAQLTILDGELEHAVRRHDGKRIRDVALAIAQLTEVERRLSGRRLPSLAEERRRERSDVGQEAPVSPIG